MTIPKNALTDTPGRWALLRWYVSSATLSMPQAGGSIAFALLALSLTRDPSRGAVIMVAMMVTQVVGAIPITRMGKHFPATAYLRWLIGMRTCALMAIAVALGVSLTWLVLFAAITGSVSGAAFGIICSLLNHLTPVSKLPRALSITATLN
jgi:peptidoglycan/LPS O-acetylase OafA/YrhL